MVLLWHHSEEPYSVLNVSSMFPVACCCFIHQLRVFLLQLTFDYIPGIVRIFGHQHLSVERWLVWEQRGGGGGGQRGVHCAAGGKQYKKKRFHNAGRKINRSNNTSSLPARWRWSPAWDPGSRAGETTNRWSGAPWHHRDPAGVTWRTANEKTWPWSHATATLMKTDQRSERRVSFEMQFIFTSAQQLFVFSFLDVE